MEKFKNKYRIASARAPFWDYSWNAAYFVTICTKNRQCWFGDVVDGLMDLSAMGHIANSCWHEIPHHFPFVELGAHVIMPNHVHGILIIKKQNDGRDGWPDGRNVETQNIASLPSTQNIGHPSTTQNIASLPSILPGVLGAPQPPKSPDSPQPSQPSQPSEMGKRKNQFAPQSQNLASIIRGFKIGVTKNARQIHPAFAWQPRFHDHIIGDDGSYERITQYIKTNTARWTP